MILKKTLTLTFLLFSSVFLFSQSVTLSGIITDAASGEAMIGATVRVDDIGTTTDLSGTYKLKLEQGLHTLYIDYLGYEPFVREIDLTSDSELNFALTEAATLLNTATVTGGKFEKPLGEVTVSLEVVKPQLIDNTNSTSVDEVLQKVPGVQIIDGQANIRGGSGFSYGAGSRVLLLVDNIPILQADAGVPNWDDIPVENIEQVEVIKGAASTLYGSSALNGVINIRTAYAKSTPETKLSTFYTYVGDPAEKSQIWYDDQPFDFGASVSHRQKIDKLDLVLGGYYLNSESYNRDTYDKYTRLNSGIRYRFTDKLSAGFNTNFNFRESGDFFFWKSLDSLFVGNRDTTSGTLSFGDRFRYNIDPFVTYFDDSGNRHKLHGRYLSIDNENNSNQSNKSQLWYSEYQFLRKWKNDFVTTAGLVYVGNSVSAELYGDTVFTTQNIAAYAQLEKKFFNKLNVSGGFRLENNQLKTPELFCNTNAAGQTICDTIPGGKIEESKPVFRLGLNYQAADLSFIRASWGQGYRFPTIAESFISTTFGAVPISPNPGLTSETGWSAEVGLKQGFKLGGFDGFIDGAVFWSEYQDMIEFNFVNFFPTGFQSINVGDTKIVGYEASIAGQGRLFGLPTNILAGYTFLDPQFQEFDNTVPDAGESPTEGQKNALGSSSDKNILKYRSRHSAKLDVETTWNLFTLGIAANYNSKIVAVDEVFESLVVPGLRQYRAENDGGNLILSLRASVKFLDDRAKFSILVNNLTNEMYSIRPGLMESPRSFTGRIDWKF